MISRCEYCGYSDGLGHTAVCVMNEVERLRDLVRRSADFIDDAYSGYIPGSGSDDAWDKGKERLLADLRAAEKPSLSSTDGTAALTAGEH